MKQIRKPILCLLLALLLLSLFTACGKSTKISIDAQGNATWKPVKGAVQYEYSIVDAEYASMGAEFTTVPSVAVPEGFSIHMRAVFEDGTTGDWVVSEYFGEPQVWNIDEPVAEFNPNVVIIVDERGYATWEPVEGAVEYRYEVVDQFGRMQSSGTTEDLTVRLPLNHCVTVWPVLEGDTYGVCFSSEYYGEGMSINAEDIGEYVDLDYSVKWSDLKTYNLIENIDFSSVKTMADGSISFTAAAPNGGKMRFVGTDVAVEDGVIKLEPTGEIYALDAIGRICAYKPIVLDPGSDSNGINFSGGYTFNGETSVERLEDLFKVWPTCIHASVALNEGYKGTPVMQKQPNMIGFALDRINSVDTVTLSEMIVYYDEATYATPLKEIHLDTYFYGTYLEGALYDPSKEVYDPDSDIYTFYLMLIPDLLDEIEPIKESILIDPDTYMNRAVVEIDPDRYTLGNLKDANGKILDKQTDPLSSGSTLEITIAGAQREVNLPIVERYAGAQTLHEMAPHTNTPSEGNITTLVIPIQWPDCPEQATEEQLEILRAKLGRVVDASGNVTDYSTDGADGFSLSRYYDMASYGKYHVDSFITDWVTAPNDYAEKKDVSPVSDDMPDKIFSKVRKMYPDMDWSRFDTNADGLLDSVILFSAGTESDGVNVASYGGAIHTRRGYGTERAGMPGRPNMKDFVTISSATLQWPNVLLHEYAHNFGIIDYYDVTYSGIDAVGMYDMESGNLGDWNAYSKYSVGWIEPTVVENLASGESVEITIGSMADTGDAIVIPAAGTALDGPFGEYMLVDLFTDGGVNEYDAAGYGLGDTVGVRIYHINANMERRDVTDIYGDTVTIGTINVANAENDKGKYHIELLQAGGDNTFTDLKNLRPNVQPQDFFQAGDVFNAAAYSEFLMDGRMDDGSEFGYTIKVVSIDKTDGSETATIRITRK